MNTDWDLERDGILLIPDVFDSITCDQLIQKMERLTQENSNHPSVLKSGDSIVYGMRNVTRFWPECSKLISQVLDHSPHARAALTCEAGLVRGLYFDKPPGKSWALPWHRDYTIAVREHRPVPGFVNPTIKAGVPHYEAPAALLETILTFRIHLDDMNAANGALCVVPGSHKSESDQTNDAVTIECARGSVLVMRPLILHASGHNRTESGSHRRILHLECSSTTELPDGLEWNQFLRIDR